MRTIRASEIGSFLYCRRAWWYRSQGIQAENQAEMAAGTSFHQQHGRQIIRSGLLRVSGWVLLLLALALLAAGITAVLLG